MVKLASSDCCSGCAACANACPMLCIDMLPDKNGFSHPSVNTAKCTQCGLCQSVCPVLGTSFPPAFSKTYACINNNLSERMRSSSGGIFILLCKEVISKNGVVFGAAYTTDFKVQHCYADTLEGCQHFIGSKYVQSNIGTCYADALNFLKQNRFVLFSGTPCQISGLKHFLKKDYPNLLTVDIICHGVPSPKVFELYKSHLEQRFNSKITFFSFRNKESGWKSYHIQVKFENQQEYNNFYGNDNYMKGFLKNLYLRPSCYQCASKNLTSGSDITIGDLWGIQHIDPSLDDNKGISLIIVNSSKGEKILFSLDSLMTRKDMDLKTCIKYNSMITKSVSMAANYDHFFDNLDSLPIDTLITNDL